MNDNVKSQPPKVKKPKAQPVSAAASVFDKPLVQAARIKDAPGQKYPLVFGEKHQAIGTWLRSVFDPATGTAGVPNSAGSFQLFTNLWQVSILGASVASSTGNAYVGVCCDSWIESGNAMGTPTTESRVLGYTTQGNLAVYTDGSVDLPTLPAVGAALPLGSAATLSVLPDSSFTALTRGRLVGCKLYVWSDESQNDGKGEILLGSSVNPAGGVKGGRINGCTFSDLTDSNKLAVSSMISSLPNWPAGSSISAIGLPAEDMAFDMVNYPSAGYTSVPFFTLCAIARGMTSNSRFMWRIDQLYETEANISRQVDKYSRPPTVHVPYESLKPYLQRSAGLRLNPTANHAIIPFMDTLSRKHPERTLRILEQPEFKAITPKGSTFMDTLSAIGQSAGSAAASTGVLKQIPVIGNFLDSAAKSLGKFFGW